MTSYSTLDSWNKVGVTSIAGGASTNPSIYQRIRAEGKFLSVTFYGYTSPGSMSEILLSVSLGQDSQKDPVDDPIFDEIESSEVIRLPKSSSENYQGIDKFSEIKFKSSQELIK